MAAATHEFSRDLWTLVKPYWFSEEKVRARLLLAAIIVLTLAMVYMSVQFNTWYNDFYNALQDKKKDEFFRQMWKFTWLALIYILIAVYAFYLNQMLQIRWRRWMTDKYLVDWLADSAYYRMQLVGTPTDNPDQRIADDINVFVDDSLSLSLGVLNASVTFVSFVGILWGLSGALDFHWRGQAYELYGYMVWVAVAYAFVGTWIMHKLGRSLIPLNFNQQRFEANFRFNLARFRENTEGVALYHGETDELTGFRARFGDLLHNFQALMKRQKILNFYSYGYNQIAIIFPYIVGAPRYFSGAIPLGGLVQISNAFGQVQGSLSWFIGAYTTFARWKATVDRLTGFHNAIDAARVQAAMRSGVVIEPAGNDNLVADGVDITLPDGRVLVSDAQLTISPRERVLLRGRAGSGKSTLFRLLAGIWPFGKGSIHTPRDFAPLFLPQRPYFPLGNLREVVSYPSSKGQFTDDQIVAALNDVGLPKLAGRLDEDAHWSQQLSGGEQQRVAFARALLQAPKWLFLDEATSSLDPESEQQMYRLINQRLPGATIVSISHEPGLAAHHTRVLEIDPVAGTLTAAA